MTWEDSDKKKLHSDEFMQRKNVKDQVKPDDDCVTW